MQKIEIPEVTRKRMAGLYQLLKTWPEDKITSAAISGSTGWKDSLIRHVGGGFAVAHTFTKHSRQNDMEQT